MSAGLLLRRLAAVAVFVAGGIHFDLWLEHGYRSVHVIGPLFLLNGITAAVLAGLLLWRQNTLVELAAFGYAATTLTAFFVSVYYGLFGFVEALDGTMQTIAALAEGSTIALLGLSLAARNHGSAPTRSRVDQRLRTYRQRRIQGI